MIDPAAVTAATLNGARGSEILVEMHRGPFPESVHRGAIVICTPDGEVVESWGDAGRVMLPRSACKMLQALPLVDSGAADAAGLGPEQLALSCASHNGAEIHTSRVNAWLAGMGMDESDLRCGPQTPDDKPAREGLRACGCGPDQTHNNCSGKHAGFLTLNRHLGGGAEYVEVDHPVQQAAKAAFYEMTGDDDYGHGIDGCSAPNFGATLKGLATAMAKMARPDQALSGARADAARRLVAAMMAHPDLVAGEARACTGLMRALNGKGAVKTGAEGVFTAILPGLGYGVALKIDDGATRASNCVMAALLVRLGLLDAADPAVLAWTATPDLNRRFLVTGGIRPAETLIPR
jgi:L-asparaginase II